MNEARPGAKALLSAGHPDAPESSAPNVGLLFGGPLNLGPAFDAHIGAMAIAFYAAPIALHTIVLSACAMRRGKSRP